MLGTLPLSRRSVLRYVTALSAGVFSVLLIWPGLLRSLFDTRTFMPHVFCYRWDPRLIWMNGVSDLAIGVAYVAISAMLTLLVHRARRDIPFSWVFLAFGLFIVACGATHLMEVVTLWMPAYWLSGAVKIVTAVASVATALVLPPLIPKTIAMVRAARQSEERRVQLQERLEALERERAARAEAEEASRSKDAFLATLSHELRTPMTAILGWSTMINAGDLDEGSTAAGISAIERSARIQAQLIDDLLDVSRIVTGKLSLDLQDTDLNAVVRQAIEGVHVAAGEKGVAIYVTYADVRLGLVADSARLHQVVTNLLSNAVKFTPEGGRITVRTSVMENDAAVTVSDTGIGIPSDFLPRIFDRFSQADESHTRRFGGLGLGLAIVKHLTELHGGTVVAQSDGPGRGSTFTVRLPLDAVLPVAEPRVAAPASDTVRLDGVRLLLVEDDDPTRQMLKTALQHYGANVTAVGSVEDAVAVLDRGLPDAVLSDIAMPRADGFELLKELRLREAPLGSRIPAVAVSALSRLDERDRIFNAGFDEFLQKPVDPARVAGLIRQLLGTKN